MTPPNQSLKPLTEKTHHDTHTQESNHERHAQTFHNIDILSMVSLTPIRGSTDCRCSEGTSGVFCQKPRFATVPKNPGRRDRCERRPLILSQKCRLSTFRLVPLFYNKIPECFRFKPTTRCLRSGIQSYKWWDTLNGVPGSILRGSKRNLTNYAGPSYS